LSKVIRVKDAISADLALRNNADSFFDDIENSRYDEIVIDFAEVKSISRSFAHQYQIRKKASKKMIRETHVPEHVAKMFRVINSSSSKSRVVMDTSAPLMTI